MRLYLIILVSCLSIEALYGQEYVVRTYAGGGQPNGLLASAVGIGSPTAVAADGAGGIVVNAAGRVFQLSSSGLIRTLASVQAPLSLSDLPGVTVTALGDVFVTETSSDRVRKISPDGTVSTLDLTPGLTVIPIPGAVLAGPTGITSDATGTLYIADTNHHRVVKVKPGQVYSVVAGGSLFVSPGFSGDNGPAISAGLRGPKGVAVDTAGNVFIADTGNHRVRKVTPGGIITTVVGNGSQVVSGDGGPAANASLSNPTGLSFDSAGNLYIVDTGHHRIRKVTPGGIITTVAGVGTAGFSGDMGNARDAALSNPVGIAADAAGNLFVADSGNLRVRKVTPGGVISTFAGNDSANYFADGVATQTALSPRLLTLDNSGNLIIADANNHRVRKVSSDGRISTVVGTGVRGYSGDGGRAQDASLAAPSGVAVDITGNIYVADTGNHRIRKVTTDGTITTVAGNNPFGGFAGDNGPALNASFSHPVGLAVDNLGNLFIADTGNNRIRRIDSSGTITTVAGNGGGAGTLPVGPTSARSTPVNSPTSIAIDSGGNLFVADSSLHAVRKISPNGVISTIVGNGVSGYSGDNGAATNARLNGPSGVTVDAAGNLFIADLQNFRIRKVTISGVISTVAGNGQPSTAAENMPSAATGVSPDAIVAAANGALYFTESDRVRILTSSSAATISVQPASLSFSGASGSQSLTVTSSVAGLPITATITAGSWLSVSASPQASPAAFAITVDAAGLAVGTFTGNIRITASASNSPIDVPVTLTTCTFSLSPSSHVLPQGGGQNSFAVSTQPGCPWVATSSASWLTIVSGANGSGQGTITVSAPANAGTFRSAVVTVGGQTFRVDQAGATASSGLRFVPLSPCRVVDTRAAYAGGRTGPFGPPRLTSGVTRTIPIRSSTTCSIPAVAKAYMLNVTLDTMEEQTGSVDFLTLWPAGEPRPDIWSLRTSTGGYIANAAIVKAGMDGAISVYASNPVNLIIDISGYFTDDPGSMGLLYYPIPPCRAVDTRGPTYSALPPPYGNQRMEPRQSRTFRLPSSPACGLPAAPAYSMQLTLAPGELTNGSPVAFLTAYPTGLPQPNISNMNSFFGYAVANSAVVPANTAGEVDVYAYDSTNLILDVNGYFAPDDGTGRGLMYFPVTQCRVVDTQDTSLSGVFGGPAMSAGSDRSIPIPLGRCGGLPSSARAWAINAAVVPNGAAVPFLSMWPTMSPWPNVSQLNAFQGQTVANSGIVPADSNGSIDVRVAGTAHVAIEVSGYFGR